MKRLYIVFAIYILISFKPVLLFMIDAFSLHCSYMWRYKCYKTHLQTGVVYFAYTLKMTAYVIHLKRKIVSKSKVVE